MVRRKHKKYDQLQKEGIDSRKRPGWARYLVLGMVLAMVMAAMAGCGRKPQDNAALAAFCPNGEKHEFDVETTHADCTQRGYTTGTCQKCGYTYMYDIVNALGHQWEEPVSLKTVSCTEDGVQSRSCGRCGIKQEEPVFHSGHSYVLSSAEGDEAQETVTYVCTVCGDEVTQYWNEPQPGELKEKTFLPDRSADFTFLVSCDQGADYLREKLTVTGENGAVSYTATAEEDGVYRIAATEPYEQYQTYYVQVAEDMLFPEYNAKALEFSIIGPDRAQVEFNEDNLVFLKALELEQYGASGRYALQWDEAAQRYFLTLFELRDIEPSMIGKVIGIGDYVSTEEILADSTRELCFARLEKISHNAEGELLLELSVPQVSEVYDKLDIYFAGGTSGMQINGDPELAFMNAVVSSEGFAEYLTAAHLAAESYAGDYGLVVTPLAETKPDNLKFELTKQSLKPIENDSACRLELGGKITYTIPLKSKEGHASGSIVLTCKAEITARISAGGYYDDKDSVDLHLTNETTTTLGFEMAFNLEYSQGYEETYLLHKNTQKIHTATCRIANKETNSANLQKLTAQELSEWYHGDREAMKQHECKVCKAVTGLDGTAYAYNKNTGVLHCMNCRHVASIKDCNLYTLYPANTFGFENCADCRPQDRQAKDFDNRMLNAIRGSDWAEQVSSFQNMLGDSIGKKKPAEATEPILSATINVAGVFNIKIGVAPVFEFDMEASVKFTITGNTTNIYGIHNVGEGFETYHDEQRGKVDYDLSFTGEADAKFGISLIVEAYPVGLDNAAYISLTGQVGLYGHFAGIFTVQGTLGGDNDAFCAARLEVGLYARVDGYWKILWFDNKFEIIQEKRFRLFKWGYDRMYYAFEEEEMEITAEDPDELVSFNLPFLMKAKYLDLTTMKYKTGNISPVSESYLRVTVDIKNEDGSACDYLEYIPQNGMIHKKANAPESFTAIITVRVTPKVVIDSLEAFKASQSKDAVFGYSMDPLVIRLTVEERKNPYDEILAMYYTGISEKWKDCDGKGWNVVGDPDNVCYMFSLYESERTLSEIGYALLDINGDGQPELFVSPMYMAESGGIYDMYTIIDGEIIHVISAGERDRYNLAEDYSFNNHGSGGALSSSDSNYKLDSNGELRVVQAVIYDGWRDSDNPWFYTTADYFNRETHEINYDVLTSISEAEAKSVRDSFPESMALELIPFAEYVSSEDEDDPENDSDTITEGDLLGEWVVDEEYTMAFNDMSMWDLYGTSFSDSGNKMTFASDGSFSYYVAWCYGNGSFELRSGEIAVNLDDAEPIQGAMRLKVMTDGVTRIALDQYGDGSLVFWVRSNGAQTAAVSYETREEVIEFRLSDGTLYYTNKITYPYFLGNSAAEKAINERYAAMIAEYKGNTTDFDALYEEVLEWSPDGVSGLPFYDDVAAEVTYCDKGVISIRECTTSWGGGMHPYSEYEGYTYSVRDGKELSLGDILSGSDQEIKDLINRYNKGAASFYEADVIMESPFMLTSEGLCFLCNVGDAVPWEKVVIPFTEKDAFSVFG